MKKLVSIVAILAFFSATKINAQVTMSDLLITSAKLKDGANTVDLPGNNKLQFNYRAHSFSGFVMLDSLGISHTLSASSTGANGATPVSCGAGQVKETYASGNKTIGLTLCKPKPATTGPVKNEFKLTIDMPGGVGPTGRAQNRRVEVTLAGQS